MSTNRPSLLFVYGMNHAIAGLDVRERHALSGEDQTRLHGALVQNLGLSCQVILSTCNRTELYGYYSEVPENLGDFEAALRHLVFPNLDSEIRPYLWRHRNPIFHLFRVSGGLDSMIVGESEILGQVRNAFEAASSKDDPGRVLSDLFQQAVRVGKRIRTETQLGEGSISVGSTAVKLASKVVGDLNQKTGLVVGAGETARLVGRHLKSAGMTRLTLLNRTPENAREAAAELDAESGGLDQLSSRIGESDVVITCVEASEPVITLDTLDRADARTRCIIDISVPRGVAPEVAEHRGALVMDIDDLARLVESNREGRLEHVEDAEEILVSEVHKFLSLQSFSELSPLVNRLKATFAETVEGFIVEESGESDDKGDSRRLASLLLAATLEDLKMSSRLRHSLEDVRAGYRTFLGQDEGGE